MRKIALIREITPLTSNDCFMIFSRMKSKFDFPMHQHEEFELNFIENAKDAKRVVGKHSKIIDNLELVLVGPNLQHGWFTNKCKTKSILEITIHFPRDLFDDKFLQRTQVSQIKSLLENSLGGVSFSKETIERLMPRIKELPQKSGFNSVIELLSIIHELSISDNIKRIADLPVQNQEKLSYKSGRIEKIIAYVNNNFDKGISLNDAARLAGMTEVAFSRFFKLRTGKTLVDTINEVRLGNASRMLIDTNHTITEVAYKCGFNNMSNFNRIFKKKKDCTPKEFREANAAHGQRSFI